MLLNPKTVEIIELTIKKQLAALKLCSLMFDRTDKTPNKVTNFRDFQLGEFLGGLKMKHMNYVEQTLNRELTDEELDELSVIFSRYQDDIADFYYNC